MPTKLVWFKIMKISKKSQYGLRAMVCLANEESEFCSLRIISEKEKIPFSYLEKIFSKLEKSGLIDSKKGVQGGYALSKPTKKIKVGEIMRALEEELVLVECIGAKGVCSKEKSCKTIGLWKKLQESMEKTIDSITLYDLTKE